MSIAKPVETFISTKHYNLIYLLQYDLLKLVPRAIYLFILNIKYKIIHKIRIHIFFINTTKKTLLNS